MSLAALKKQPQPAPLTDDEAKAIGIIEMPLPNLPDGMAERMEQRNRQETHARKLAHQKQLPHSIEAEKGVLGSILLSPKRCMYEAEGKVGKSYFYDPANADIFTTLCELHRDNEPIDLVSVTQALDQRGILENCGGPAYITELFTFVPTAANFSYYLELLFEKYKLRETHAIGVQLGAAGLNSLTPEELNEQINLVSERLRKLADIGLTDSGIEVHRFGQLMNLDVKNDENSVLGYRYLCRGGAALIVGQSGIGKSSLSMQQAMMWAQGKALFGLGPTKGKPLKSLFIQAENDEGDLAEMMQGVLRKFPIPEGMSREEFIAMMDKRMVFVRDTIHTGKDFARTAARLIDREKPDLVWADPLLSYAGDDISSQKVASEFLRNTLNPIAFDTGIIWMLLHHTGKPSTDPKAKAHWTDHDFSYAAFGSSELVNWARAVMVLRSIGQGRFELRFSKRGKRTGVTEYQEPDVHHPDKALFTDVVYIEHAKDAIYWEQIAKPEDLDEPKKPERGKTGHFEQQFTDDDLMELIEKFPNGRKPKEILNVAKEQIGMSERTFWNLWKKLKTMVRVIERDGRWYANTPNNQEKVYAAGK